MCGPHKRINVGTLTAFARINRAGSAHGPAAACGPHTGDRIAARALRFALVMAASAVAATAAAASARAAPRVLVVGGGPVGMAAAFLLERLYAVPVRVVERQRQPTAHPQAHFLNLRTMEVLYATMPGFHDRLLQHAAPSDLVMTA